MARKNGSRNPRQLIALHPPYGGTRGMNDSVQLTFRFLSPRSQFIHSSICPSTHLSIYPSTALQSATHLSMHDPASRYSKIGVCHFLQVSKRCHLGHIWDTIEDKRDHASLVEFDLGVRYTIIYQNGGWSYWCQQAPGLYLRWPSPVPECAWFLYNGRKWA